MIENPVDSHVNQRVDNTDDAKRQKLCCQEIGSNECPNFFQRDCPPMIPESGR